MSEQDRLLTSAEREALAQWQQTDAGMDGQRAAALLAVDAGQSQAEAAETAGLTTGQLTYFLRKFREERMDAFSAAVPAIESVDLPEGSNEAQIEALRQVIDELNDVLLRLQAIIPGATALRSTSASYSPQSIMLTIRDNFNRLTPDMQLDVLRNLQGMSAEDFMDIDTWKGMGYMVTYSARFQATQTFDKVSGLVNQVVPEPLQPRRFWNFGWRTVDRITPDFAKQITATFRDATFSDLTDIDTWKGVAYMLTYSIQFQIEQLRDRLIAMEDKQRAA